jgi:hypothetical protein
MVKSNFLCSRKGRKARWLPYSPIFYQPCVAGSGMLLSRIKGPAISVSRIQATTLHPYHRCASPRVANDITPRRNQGSQIAAITNPCDNAYLAHGMSPVDTGSGGPYSLEDSPHSLARENGQRARSPQIKSVLCCIQAGELTGNDNHYPKSDSGRENYYYHESQLALLLNRWGAWAP